MPTVDLVKIAIGATACAVAVVVILFVHHGEWFLAAGAAWFTLFGLAAVGALAAMAIATRLRGLSKAATLALSVGVLSALGFVVYAIAVSIPSD